MHTEWEYAQRSYVQEFVSWKFGKSVYTFQTEKKMHQKLYFCIQFCSRFNVGSLKNASLGSCSALRNHMQELKRHMTSGDKILKDSTDTASKFRLSSLHINIRDATCMLEKIIKLWSFSWDKHCLDIQECPWLLPILLHPQNVPFLVNVKKE